MASLFDFTRGVIVISIQKQFYELQASSIIKQLEKRRMKGFYCSTKEDARELVLSLIEEGSSVSWGGSMSIVEAGILDALYERDTNTLLDRAKCAPDQIDTVLRQSFFSDYYLMSSNAITLDGQLVNIDGAGNRVAAMIFGPQNVLMVVGMNKVTATVDEAINRVHNIASPQNTLRLGKETPCAKTGMCHNCLSPDCICMQTVITRNSRVPNRIQVILVGEALGY
ncbi:MAG: lactate utilization protein [Cellulosilyticaceae bacterium]